jgi:hypothetical protein
MVLAAPDTDPEAPPTPCKVVQVYHNAPARIFEVHVAGEVIQTTANHPFHVKGKGWVKVKDLAAGDELRTAEGELVKVERVADSGETEPVFNLQVELSHTYLVVLPESRQAILVHNESQSVVGGFFSDWGNYYKQAAQSTWNATKYVANQVGNVMNGVGQVSNAAPSLVAVGGTIAWQKWGSVVQSNTYKKSVDAIMTLSMLLPGEGAAVEGAGLLKEAETGAAVAEEHALGEAHSAAQYAKLKAGYRQAEIATEKSLASQQQVEELGERIAGEGTGMTFRDAGRVAARYGGSPADWVKMRSPSYLASDGTRLETHWVENIRTGARVEFKTKFVGGVE